MSDLTSRIMDYEAGNLDFPATVELFQDLVDSGLAWTLQGHYGRTAMHFIRSGHVKLPPGKVTHEEVKTRLLNRGHYPPKEKDKNA